MYFKPDDLVNSQNNTLSLPRGVVSPSFQNPTYAQAQLAIERSKPSLPSRNGSIATDTTGADHHYDTIPALSRPPSKRMSGDYHRLTELESSDSSADMKEASPKYDQLQMTSGKYDHLEHGDSVEVIRQYSLNSPTDTAQNPYVIEPGPIPGATGHGYEQPIIHPDQKGAVEMEAVAIQVPSSRENPYDSIHK